MKKYMAMVCGKSGTGKTMTLHNLKNPKGVWYLNCEGDEELPFDHEFRMIMITDPKTVIDGILYAETKTMEECHTIAIDTLTFLCDMYINQYVIPSDNPQAEWGVYARWVQNLMFDTVAKSTKNILFLAHTVEEKNEEKVIETKVVVPGKKLNVQGMEAFFNIIVGTKKMELTDLKDYANPLLTFNEKEKRLGFKHVIQTQVTRETMNERLRGKNDMWSFEETFIDNDIQIVLDRLHKKKTQLAAVK